MKIYSTKTISAVEGEGRSLLHSDVLVVRVRPEEVHRICVDQQ